MPNTITESQLLFNEDCRELFLNALPINISNTLNQRIVSLNALDFLRDNSEAAKREKTRKNIEAIIDTSLSFIENNSIMLHHVFYIVDTNTISHEIIMSCLREVADIFGLRIETIQPITSWQFQGDSTSLARIKLTSDSISMIFKIVAKERFVQSYHIMYPHVFFDRYCPSRLQFAARMDRTAEQFQFEPNTQYNEQIADPTSILRYYDEVIENIQNASGYLLRDEILCRCFHDYPESGGRYTSHVHDEISIAIRRLTSGNSPEQSEYRRGYIEILQILSSNDINANRKTNFAYYEVMKNYVTEQSIRVSSKEALLSLMLISASTLTNTPIHTIKEFLLSFQFGTASYRISPFYLPDRTIRSIIDFISQMERILSNRPASDSQSVQDALRINIAIRKALTCAELNQSYNEPSFRTFLQCQEFLRTI